MGVIPFDVDECEFQSLGECEDIIMHMEEDEGLLPDLLSASSCHDDMQVENILSSSPLIDDTSAPQSSPVDDGFYFSEKPVASGASYTDADVDKDIVAILSDDSSVEDSVSDEDSFFSDSVSLDDSRHSSSSTASVSFQQEGEFQERLANFYEAIKRTQQTRHSLYYSQYRSPQTDAVLYRAEYSTHQVDCFCRDMMQN